MVGATRSAGRGIAVQPGAAGATVYVTGRTTAREPSEMNRRETIKETAELVEQAGGHGIALQVDRMVPEQVRELDSRMEKNHEVLHVLDNDIFGATHIEWNKTVWESDLAYGLHTVHLAVDTHAITSHFVLPLLIQSPGGLVIVWRYRSNLARGHRARAGVRHRRVIHKARVIGGYCGRGVSCSRPVSTALRHNTATLTFQEMDTMANRIYSSNALPLVVDTDILQCLWRHDEDGASDTMGVELCGWQPGGDTCLMLPILCKAISNRDFALYRSSSVEDILTKSLIL